MRVQSQASEPRQHASEFEEAILFASRQLDGCPSWTQSELQTLEAVPKVASHTECVAGNQVRDADIVASRVGRLVSVCDLASGVCFDNKRYPDAH